MQCNVCLSPLDQPVYVSAGDVSITTMLEIFPHKTQVFFCTRCGHTQTPQLADLDAFYDKHYKILNDSEEEDQLYEVIGDKVVFRMEHQARTLLAKNDLPHGARILDYGCAKGGTLKRVQAARPDLEVHLFDVTNTYVPFWQKFVPPERWAAYAPRPEWAGRFDLIASFFALEHVADPRAMLAAVAQLLKPGGVFYCLIPNVYNNLSDFVVADHVNHFSAASLHWLLASLGFETVEIDEKTHTAAFIVTGRYRGTPQPLPDSAAQIQALHQRVKEMAGFWQSFGRRVQEFEQSHAGQPAAIYGSGFYGNFIATCLADRTPVRCFVDRDPYRQGKQLWDRPIVAPEKLPEDVRVLYVGLNPVRARAEIQKVTCWEGRPLTFYYP